MTDLACLYGEYQSLRGFRPATIRRRTTTLHTFTTAHGPLERATTEHVAAFLAGYPNPRTRHSYRSDLTAFYRWAQKRGHVDHNPCDLIDGVKVPKSLPRPLDARLVPRLIASADDPDTRLMVALGLYAGLRRAEIAVLSTDDITPTVLIVRSGKGGKDRMVPLHPVILDLVYGRPPGRLFDCTPDTVGRRIKRHLQAQGVHATAHQLRHTFGTELARVTDGDLLMVGTFMGHESATTTQGYAAFVNDTGARAINRMFT